MLRQDMEDARRRARDYTRAHGEDIPEVTEWAWGQNKAAAAGYAETGGDNT
jgi:xylulose-5-phosphate/fructose-6-phosphate phosphoketolase